MADKTLKSLKIFGGADNYFPLPIVSTNDNNKILSVVNGEWVVKEAPSCDDTGQYVWSKRDSADGPVTGYVISNDGEKYPNGGWSNGVYYTLELDPRILMQIEITTAPTIVEYTEGDPLDLTGLVVTATFGDGSTEDVTSQCTMSPAAGTVLATTDTSISISYTYKGVTRSTSQIIVVESAAVPYLSFIGNEDFTLKTNEASKNWDGTLEYSTDKSTWNTWNGTEISSAGSKLYLRGTGNTKITGDLNNYRFVFTGTDALKIACEGNIENLLDYETVSAGGHPTMADNCYRYMFQYCKALTTAPELLATTLTPNCYRYMFAGCTALTTAPELPATTLAAFCYGYMFQSCTALTTAPALPATTLADNCYDSMFSGCTSLTTAPELPATTLANKCYIGMFTTCRSLTTAPELPATTLAANCYQTMFYECTALTTAPELPATTLAANCYQSMFNRCTSLTTPPSVLPATTLAPNCYRFMFEFTAIDAIPKIMATTYATDSCKGMFDDIKTLNVYSTSGNGHTYGWTAPSSASTYCSGMFGSDDNQSEWAKLDGSNFPNSGTPTDGKTYYFKTVV